MYSPGMSLTKNYIHYMLLTCNLQRDGRETEPRMWKNIFSHFDVFSPDLALAEHIGTIAEPKSIIKKYQFLTRFYFLIIKQRKFNFES